MDEQKILIHIQEELKDAQEYLTMYHETNEGIFHDLAEEELSHAKILKHLHSEKGFHADHQIEEAIPELESAMIE